MYFRGLFKVIRPIEKCGLILGGTLVSLLFAESVLRMFGGDGICRGRKVFGGEIGARPQVFVVDDELGYRPEIDGKTYNKFGTAVNKYPIEKRRGYQRVLFLGDSVTRRGFIIQALREKYGVKMIEYWNGGVTGYNTVQELKYYERYNRSIQADHIVLTLHWNDFSITPVVLQKEEGQVVVGEVKSKLWFFHPWLFRHSHLFRFLVRAQLSTKPDILAMRREVAEALEEFQRVVKNDGAQFSVIIFPQLSEPATWSSEVREDHSFTLATLARLNIRAFDLRKPLERAIADHLDIQQEPGDLHHPSRALSRYFAEELFASKLFETPVTESAANPSKAGTL